MYSLRSKRVDDRIISVNQPYLRPIVSGKVKPPTEFGAKISVAVVNGFTFLDRLRWDAFNEAGDLGVQVEKYSPRCGHYSLGRIMTKLAVTSKSVIALTFLVMNLHIWQVIILYPFSTRGILRWWRTCMQIMSTQKCEYPQRTW